VKAQPLPDNSPEGFQRRARAATEKRNAAFWAWVRERVRERDSELAAMSTEERLRERIKDEEAHRLEAYPAMYEAIQRYAHLFRDGAPEESSPEWAEFHRLINLACLGGIESIALGELNAAKAKAGARMRPITSADVYSASVPQYMVHAAVLSCYPNEPENPSRWWKVRIKGRVHVRRVNGKRVEVNLTQLCALFPNLTEEALAPLRRAS
jgi:hypothetical protein